MAARLDTPTTEMARCASMEDGEKPDDGLLLFLGEHQAVDKEGDQNHQKESHAADEVPAVDEVHSVCTNPFTKLSDSVKKRFPSTQDAHASALLFESERPKPSTVTLRELAT